MNVVDLERPVTNSTKLMTCVWTDHYVVLGKGPTNIKGFNFIYYYGYWWQ